MSIGAITSPDGAVFKAAKLACLKQPWPPPVTKVVALGSINRAIPAPATPGSIGFTTKASPSAAFQLKRCAILATMAAAIMLDNAVARPATRLCQKIASPAATMMAIAANIHKSRSLCLVMMTANSADNAARNGKTAKDNKRLSLVSIKGLVSLTFASHNRVNNGSTLP